MRIIAKICPSKKFGLAIAEKEKAETLKVV